MGWIRAILNYFKTGPDAERIQDPSRMRKLYERYRLSVFLSVTIGYGFFYVCRLNFSVAKKEMLTEKILSADEMGFIGFVMLIVYAFGKFFNGILADRSNIRKFMSIALAASAATNLLLGIYPGFLLFAILWGVNGWFQAVGAAPSVVSLSQWFTPKERGTRYGIWSVGHSLGEGLTFIGTAVLVNEMGWRAAFWGPALLCLGVAWVLSRTLADRPETLGLPNVNEYMGDGSVDAPKHESVGSLQREVLANPAVWILGLSSAMMYVTRYGFNNWGVLFLQESKGYSLVDAGSVLSVYPIAGVLGAASSGWVSDKFFGSRRNLPNLIYAIIEIGALLLLAFAPPGSMLIDSIAMAIFGFALGGLLVFLGGLMAVDICSQRAAGAAMGLVGLLSYAGAAIQDWVSGVLLDWHKVVSIYDTDEVIASLSFIPKDGQRLLAALAPDTTLSSTHFVFTEAYIFWVGASMISLVLALFVWKSGRKPGTRP